MIALTDPKTLNNGITGGGVEDFRRDEEFRRLNSQSVVDNRNVKN